MNEELTIILGLGIISALFAYFAFEFLSKKEESLRGFSAEKALGVLFFVLSIVFLNMIMYSILLVSINAGGSYLTNSILTTGVQIIMYATLGGIALYLFALLFAVIILIYRTISKVLNHKTTRRKTDNAEES
jgi:phosphotransferase system  glucose/maltose/N-acetylglucosamine-specific IIC component